MFHCWAICSKFDTVQYSTKPAGKKMNITANATGMYCNIFCCIGSMPGAIGCSFDCA